MFPKHSWGFERSSRNSVPLGTWNLWANIKQQGINNTNQTSSHVLTRIDMQKCGPASFLYVCSGIDIDFLTNFRNGSFYKFQ